MDKKELEEDVLASGKSAEKKPKKTSGKKKQRKGISKNTAKIIKSCVCVVVVVALPVCYVATGTARKGVIASTGLPAKCFTSLTVSDGENKANIKVATYNFYYATTYNQMRNTAEQYSQYGLDLADAGMDVDFTKKLSKQTYTDTETNEEMTWEEHMHELTLDAIKNTYVYYLEAVAANDGKEPEITEEQQNEIQEALDSYKESAQQYHYSLDAYLTAAMGKGVDEKLFRQEVTRQYIAQNYQSDLQSGAAQTNYTDEDIQAYLDEHLEDYQTVDVMLYECSSEDEAKEFASKLSADGSNFGELASSYATDDYDKEVLKDNAYSTFIGATKSVLQQRTDTNGNPAYAISAADSATVTDEESSETTYPGLDYLFSTDRTAGEVYTYSTTVAYIIEPVSLSERNIVNVRHILIYADDELEATEQSTASADKWAEAYDKAQDILKQWQDGDATEDSFAELAKENSADSSASNGGLIENITTGTMVNSFNTWIFDSARKAGDTAIVRSDYGYHVMYFSSEGDQTVYAYQISQTLASEDSTTTNTELLDSYTVSENIFGSCYNQKDYDFSN